MAITRKFLDWREPALPAVVDYLSGRFARSGQLDLDNVLLVLPGGRAARRLTQLLVSHCQEHQLVLLPAEHCTVGKLPEYLYESHQPFANEVTQQLAWVHVLQQADRDRAGPFIARFPAEDDVAGWMELGALLQRQHRELAADALDFSEVAKRGSGIRGFTEQDRWEFLSRVQLDYLNLLDPLQLWDLQTARLYAIRHHLCRTDKQIVLVGTTDMNVAMRQMLDQVADQVTTLIHAPADWAEYFDSHGCLQPDKWQDVEVPLRTEQIEVVEGPAEQSIELTRQLATLDGRYQIDEVVVGVLDETIVPQLQRQLEQSRVPARWVVGREMVDTAPYRLLQAAARYVTGRRFRDFAALARHADVSQWLSDRLSTRRWLTELDSYHARHLPARLDQWLDNAAGKTLLPQVVEFTERALEPLSGEPRPLTDWPAAIAQVLSTFYGKRTFAVDNPQDFYALRALEQIREGLLQCQEIPASVTPSLPAARALEQVLSRVAAGQIPSPREDEQLELLGWLELPLDTAPVLIVTGFNEGSVPTSVNSDLFLPNQLRQQLDLMDNRRRYARDAYALSVLQASRRHLSLIAARRSADYDPLAPSRLAFATDLTTMAQRALAFFEEPVEEPVNAQGNATLKPAAPPSSALVVPRPQPLAEPITSLSVTSFRAYLQCPYRFYLRYVLGLKPVDDAAEELDAASFGNLIHEVLSRFGHDQTATSTDPDQIHRFLQRTLEELVEQQLGSFRLPAIDVQLAQARQRLRAFAHWQAERAKGGWQILDYKTSDTAKSPQQTHLKSGEWVDLQLPLYVHLARTLGIVDNIALGYILLPKETEKVGLVLAPWDEAVLATADQRALELAGDILAQRFWPPSELPPGILSDYASICQEHAFRPNWGEQTPVVAKR